MKTTSKFAALGLTAGLAVGGVTGLVLAVPAVSGACLMVERSLWDQVGGLQPGYVQGGYEDSDLCLRLIDAGRDNWYLPSVTLHHLEDQSFPSEARTMATAYNLWLQTHRWGARIEELMRDQRFSAAV
jgi:GT2 family glycosyltransferase